MTSLLWIQFGLIYEYILVIKSDVWSNRIITLMPAYILTMLNIHNSQLCSLIWWVIKIPSSWRLRRGHHSMKLIMKRMMIWVIITSMFFMILVICIEILFSIFTLLLLLLLMQFIRQRRQWVIIILSFIPSVLIDKLLWQCTWLWLKLNGITRERYSCEESMNFFLIRLKWVLLIVRKGIVVVWHLNE